MVGKISVLNIVPFKLYKLVRRMEQDLEAAFQVATNTRHMSPEMLELAADSGIDPLQTEQEMEDIMNNIELRLDRIFLMAKHMNDYPEEVNQELLEGFIYGAQLDYPRAGNIGHQEGVPGQV